MVQETDDDASVEGPSSTLVMSAEAGEEAARDSLLLFNLCCDVGFSREQWQQRVADSDLTNTLVNYSLLSEDWQNHAIKCGSSAEGVAAVFLGSDIDALLPFPGVAVIERGPIPDRVSNNVFQFVPTEHEAYVRLQLVAVGDRKIHDVRHLLTYCETDESGRTVFNGGRYVLYFLERRDEDCEFEGQTRHGPALTHMLTIVHDMDSVFCVHCTEWPSMQTEWIHRHRPYNWPSPDTIKEIVDGGCELVAVGHPCSPAPHLEWRLSSSSAEKRLVRSFNIYQIQCYFLLKLVLVFLIKPLVPHTLCSYHMKTIMLHVVETTDPADWTQRNLTRCFMKCISVLLQFLEQGNCPQYFIPKHNLFDPKVRGETQRQLVRIVRDLLAEGWRCVLRCAPFSNAIALCQHAIPRCPCFIRYWHELKYNELLDRMLYGIKYVMYSLLSCVQDQSHLGALGASYNLLSMNQAILGARRVHFPCRETVTKLQLFMKGTIGYGLLAAARCRNSQNPRLLGPILQYARQCLQDSCDFDVTSCRLKLATFYYQTGQKDQCIKVVKEMLGHCTGGTLPVCSDSDRMKTIDDAAYRRRFALTLLLGSDLSTMLNRVAFPVVFTAWEVVLAPAAVGELLNSRPLITEIDREFHSILSIDPIIYACYLLVVCYHDLGDPVKSRQTLELMGRTVLNHRQHSLFYPEVARLILDHCVQYTADHPGGFRVDI